MGALPIVPPVARIETFGKIPQRVVFNGRAYILHELEQKPEIMQAAKPEPKNLLGFEQMADIGPGEIFAGVTIALIIQRREIVGIRGVEDAPLENDSEPLV